MRYVMKEREWEGGREVTEHEKEGKGTMERTRGMKKGELGKGKGEGGSAADMNRHRTRDPHKSD